MATLTRRQNRIARFRTILNDLKRDEATAARELGEDLEYLREILSGKKELPRRIISKATKIWPINERDLLSIDHDAPEGVVIMTGDASKATNRQIFRGGAPYYDYRDLAMTRTSDIRPEWISMLHEVDDDDPDNPTIQWNKGHLLFQFTYFRGDINYYYEWNGVKHCTRMSDGDSVFGLPYAPHSFALRKGSGPGHILALTFAGRISGPLRDQLELLPGDLSSHLVPAGAGGLPPVAALIDAYAANAAMPVEMVANELGWSPDFLKEVREGRRSLDFDELKALAGELRIPVREFVPPLDDLTDGVVIVKRQSNDRRWQLPADGPPAAYVKELATSELVPYMRGLEIEAISPEPVWQRCQMHTFAYNIGGSDIELKWQAETERSVTLPPESSCVILPFVSHAFTPAGGGNARVLLMRTSPQLTGDAYLEARILGPKVVERMRSDMDRWY